MNLLINNLNIIFKSDFDNAKKTLEKLTEFIKSNIPWLTKEDIYDIKLIFSELIFNAIIHGNKHDVNKIIVLSVEILGDGTVSSMIADEGPGFDYNHILSHFSEDNEFSEHGRGVKLVKALSDSLYFNEEGNKIHFTKRVRKNNVQSNHCRQQ